MEQRRAHSDMPKPTIHLVGLGLITVRVWLGNVYGAELRGTSTSHLESKFRLGPTNKERLKKRHCAPRNSTSGIAVSDFRKRFCEKKIDGDNDYLAYSPRYAGAVAQLLLGWNPPELPPKWWSRDAYSGDGASVPRSEWADPCLEARGYVQMVSEFGQTGNVLTEFRNNLQMAILSTPRPRKLILSEAFEKFVGDRRSFDALGATHSWACVFENRSAAVSHARRANASVFELNAADSYFQASLRQQLRAVDANGTHLVDGFEPQVVTRHEYSQIVMAQTILRPTPPLLVHVEAFMESELACFQKAAGITDAGDGTPQTSAAAAAAAASGSINRRPEVGDAVVFTMDKTSWIDGEEAVGEPDVGPCEARPHLSFKRLDEFVVAAVEGDCFSSTR